MLESVTFIDWSVFRGGICYLNREAKPGTAIEFYDFATGEISQVAVLEDPPSPFGLSVSPDGRWIVYLKDETAADIMLVENFR